VAEQRVHGVELVQQLLLWSPLSAAVNAAVGVLLLFIMRPHLEPTPARAFIRTTSPAERE
jgi:hypothetical protein